MRLASRLRARALVGALAALVGLLPRTAAAQTPLVPGAWVRFSWFDGIGPIDDPTGGFLLSLLVPGRVRLTDGYGSGDAFRLYVDGLPALSTPAVASGVDGWDADDAAWANPALSKGELLLGRGDYLLDVVVREDAGFGFGDGFLRADLVGTNVVPEPASVALVATGLAGLTVAVRRRRAR